MSFIYSFAVKRLFRFEKGQFLEFWKLVTMLKIGFHGDNFAARQMAYFIFHYNFVYS